MKPSDYLDSSVPAVNLGVVTHAHDDIGEGEDIGPDGRGTNRSTYVDHVNSRFGSPLGSYWCANAVGGWWEDAGADIPPDSVGSAERWRAWAFQTRRFRERPYPGFAVVYGDVTHAHHIGIIARVVPDLTALGGHRIVTIEGNSSLGAFTRDGWIVAERTANLDALIGFVSPDPDDGRL